jgi:hypothetical protein
MPIISRERRDRHQTNHPRRKQRIEKYARSWGSTMVCSLDLGLRHGQSFGFFCGNQMTSTTLYNMYCLGHTFERDYDNAEHISQRQLPGSTHKDTMAMTYKVVVARLKAMSMSDFKENVLGMKKIEGEWRWANGDAL